jgi:ketosteroid isomerase-like protein
VSENLDLVRSIHAEWERGDYRSAEWADLEIEVVITDGPTPGKWTGRASMARVLRDFLSAWSDAHAEPGTYHALDSERVLVLSSFTGRGKKSKLGLGEVRTQTAAVFYVRDRKVTRLIVYWDRDHGLADLGLKE